MELYFFEKYYEIYSDIKGKQLTDALINCALCEYGIKDGIIRRTEEGKPFVFNYTDTYISVSHSGNYFVCIIGKSPVGVDIQVDRKVDYHRIAKRYFTEAERCFMDERGEDGFFILWTRKEAFAKLKGTGLREIIAKTQVIDRNDVRFVDFQLERGLYGSWCTE